MAAPNIWEYIRGWKKILEPYIENYLAALIEKQKNRDPRIAELYEIFREAGRGGKCIRGSLVGLGYEIALGRAATEEILPACAAFEVLQTAILGHDDIIDKSPLRRGRDSVWRAAARRVARQAGARHYGISQAICLGDVGILLANRLVTESAFDAEKKFEALKIFFDVQLNTVDGEMLDVLMSHEKIYDDEEGVLTIASLKTAWYTIVGPLRLGAVLAGAFQEGAPPGLPDAMKRYGMSLGVAFQLKDDILGIDAEEEETGKSGASDIAEGKVTLPAHYAMKRATPEQLERLRLIYGKENVSESDRNVIRDIFESTGAFAETIGKMETYLAAAREVIPEITQDAEKTELLEQLCDLMLQRKS